MQDDACEYFQYIPTVSEGAICKYSFTTLIAAGGQLHTVFITTNTYA